MNNGYPLSSLYWNLRTRSNRSLQCLYLLHFSNGDLTRMKTMPHQLPQKRSHELSYTVYRIRISPYSAYHDLLKNIEQSAIERGSVGIISKYFLILTMTSV